MRRAMLAALSVIALALASPGAALAHHGHRGHRHKGKAAHHARVHFEHFGAPAPTSSGTTTASGTSGGQQTTTSSPTEVVGTVTSFEKEEILTITLNDGSTVKGKVTSNTQIECMTATSPTPSSTEESPGDDKGSGDDESHEGDQRSSDEEQQQSKEDGGDDDSGTATAAAEPVCGTAALTSGTGVREAELKIGPAGTEFESIELVK